mmetsp:Transcript_90099/g.258049  ORF Transcript_90099/g.258049 Transcript_90099/m.258049 type:complete len:248 (-) Transcript_90099:1240-1983(-)
MEEGATLATQPVVSRPLQWEGAAPPPRRRRPALRPCSSARWGGPSLPPPRSPCTSARGKTLMTDLGNQEHRLRRKATARGKRSRRKKHHRSCRLCMWLTWTMARRDRLFSRWMPTRCSRGAPPRRLAAAAPRPGTPRGGSGWTRFVRAAPPEGSGEWRRRTSSSSGRPFLGDRPPARLARRPRALRTSAAARAARGSRRCGHGVPGARLERAWTSTRVKPEKVLCVSSVLQCRVRALLLSMSRIGVA